MKIRGWYEGVMLQPVDLTAPASTDSWLGHYDAKLLQYTGINDSDGVEIYDGDIVACINSDGTIDVIDSVTQVDPVTWTFGEYRTLECSLAFIGREYYVLGNVYEHAEWWDKYKPNFWRGR